MEEIINISFAGKVNTIGGQNPRSLYPHQKEAIKKMNNLNQKSNFSTMLVLPTGGGKTVTAVQWLLREAINKNKKILWIAHRHLLLEQAADTFIDNSYEDILYNISSYNYRVISGKHDRPINIKSTDDVLIISKDSITRNLDLLKDWLKNENEIYLVIDEAHHATAKSYRKIIDYVEQEVPDTKVLGLTATPFRTAENEKGLLLKIFKDSIVFKVDLKDLIKKEILSRPNFEECETEILLGENMGLNALKSIEHLDSIPEDIAESIATNRDRNNIIVRRYAENIEKYGQTIVFAVNRIHAITLKALFDKREISSEIIISGTQAEFIGINISNQQNEENIERYKRGELQVLINVNILTEGVDLPKTKTVFLARPTVSSILMTQMIGRALRGEKSGGTKEANIVSFIDNWNEKIAWVNAEETIENEIDIDFLDNYRKYEKRMVHTISIAKIEEFAKIMDETVDTSRLESIEFIKRIPLGIYILSFIDDNLEKNHQVLVYDSTKEYYEEFIKDLPLFFQKFKIEEETIEEEKIENLISIIENTYFNKHVIPAYDKKDIEAILKYYAQKTCEPKFITFDEIDRKKLDLYEIAKEIKEKDMRESEKNIFINNIWDEEESIIKMYFSKKIYFRRQLETEILKLDGDFELYEPGFNVEYESRELNKLSLYEIGKVNPERYDEIRSKIYEKYTDKTGAYYCKDCGYKSPLKAMFQIDHIKPMSKGGVTEVVNLQLLCRKCNLIKSDKSEELNLNEQISI